jgi:hypothetical protein
MEPLAVEHYPLSPFKTSVTLARQIGIIYHNRSTPEKIPSVRGASPFGEEGIVKRVLNLAT